MPLYGLANEELDAIFQLLAHDRQTRTLFAICLASRRLLEIGIRSLYTILDLRLERRKTAIVTTFMQRKELGAHVRMLYAHANAHGHHDIMNFFLLSAMPNLREAYFTLSPSSVLLTWIVDVSPRGLHNLTSLSVAREAFDIGMNLDDIAKSLAHPCLKKLSIRSIHDPEESHESRERLVARRGTSTITDLSLRFWGLSNRALEAVLQVPKQIRRLSMDPMSRSKRGEALDPSAIIRGLERSQHSLKFLRVADDHPAMALNSSPSFTAEALNKFSVLKQLETHLSMLITKPSDSGVASVISLPNSLQHLTVYWDRPTSVDRDAFLEMLRSSRPKELTCLHLRGNREHTESGICLDGTIRSLEDQLALTLGAACREYGMAFKDEGSGLWAF